MLLVTPEGQHCALPFCRQPLPDAEMLLLVHLHVHCPIHGFRLEISPGQQLQVTYFCSAQLWFGRQQFYRVLGDTVSRHTAVRRRSAGVIDQSEMV